MNAIAVFARAPIPGQVKTRLAQSIGPETAAEVYRAMLHDTLSLACCAERMVEACEVFVFYTPSDAFAEGPYSLNFWQGERFHQSEGDLGERMLDCMSQLQDRGVGNVVIIGSDSPHLPPDFIRDAFTMMHSPAPPISCKDMQSEGSALVFGPATDGGFYLIGASRPVPPTLFADIKWSSETTLAKVLDNADRDGLTTAQLPVWADVDTIEDLYKLAQARPHYRRFLLHHDRDTVKRLL